MGLYSSGPMTNMCGRLSEPLARLFPDPPARWGSSNDFVAAQKEQTLPDLIALFSAED